MQCPRAAGTARRPPQAWPDFNPAFADNLSGVITLDHIAYAGPSLDACHDAFQAASGLELPLGGQHAQMGTHNRLCQFGNDTYLELIAPDADQQAPDRPRWFGLDNPPSPPALTSWILRTDDLTTALNTARGAGVDLGQTVPFQRGDLRWLFSLRDDGAIPLAGAAPMIIEWQSPGDHPSRNMADPGLRLESLTIETPFEAELRALLSALGLEDFPDITHSQKTRLTATYDLNGRRFIY